MLKWIISVCIAISLVSCGTYTPPKQYQFPKVKTYDLNYDVVWDGLIKWFGDNGTPIKNLDKASGFIATESNLSTSVLKYMDCGEGGTQYEGLAKANVVVARESNNKTTVTINTFFSCHLRYMGWDVGRDERIDCNSNGRFENEIFNFIEQNSQNTSPKN